MSQIVDAKSERVYRKDTLEDYRRDVVRAIEVVHDRLGEPLTVDDLAASALLSRFHFTRVFTKVTGVSPARFLAAVRMQDAKRLLLKTDRSVTDICFDVGYNSLGTFTRTFADFVGFSPVRFRQLSLELIDLTIADVVRIIRSIPASNETSLLSGDVVSDRSLVLVTLGMFPTAIPRSRPIACTCLIDEMQFAIQTSPTRGACIFAAGLTAEATMQDAILGSSKILMGRTIVSQQPTLSGQIRVSLRPLMNTDCPTLFAFALVLADTFFKPSNFR